MARVAWVVLALVFLDEILVCVGAGILGAGLPAPWLFAWLLPVLVVTVWFCFASPKAPYGGRLVRPVVKVLVFGLVSLGLWLAGHPGLALGLLAYSVAVNALAQLRFVRAVADASAAA